MFKVNRRCNFGFTLVELLVVIAIIGVLVALLLPAVQAAREAARRTQCASQLKQFGIAMQNYHDVAGHFPYGSRNPGANGLSINDAGDQRQGSRLLKLLPYMEQNNLYDQLDFDGGIEASGDADNDGDIVLQMDQLGYGFSANPKDIPGFRCPSDEYVSERLGQSNYAGSMGNQAMGPGPGGTCSDYNGNDFKGPAPDLGFGPAVHGDWNNVPGLPATARTDPNPDVISGIFSRWHWGASMRQIEDGTSSVILMGEVLPRCGDHSDVFGMARANGTWFATTAPINFPTCPGEGPGHIDGTVDCWQLQSWKTSMGFKSRHPGGAYFLACDASVHFLPDGIDYITYQRLGDRRDGQSVAGWE